MNVGVGVDVGGTHISCCGVDLSTGILIGDTFAEADVNSKGSKQEIFESWAEPINHTLAALSDWEVRGLGFGMPGAFNYREGIALFENNDKYEALNGVNVKTEFGQYLNIDNPSLRFINDATAFAVGSAWFGKARDANKSICITLGTGFGSAFISGGTPAVSGNGVPEHGCLWHLPFKESIGDEYFSTRWFVKAFHKRTGGQVKGVKEMIETNHPEVKSIFDEFGENLATFLRDWIKGFEPEILVIAGNISKAWSHVAPSFHSKLNDMNLHLNVAISDLMEEAAISGSSRLINDDFWSKVKDDLPDK